MPGHVMIIAGETSGDALGADLMQALSRRQSNIMVTGIGGSKMIDEGLASIFPMSEIAVMGFKEILPRLPQLFKLIDKAVAHALATEPDVMVLIDSPEFNHRVAKRVKAKRPEAKIICYVAPHVWAWRRGRARKMKNYFDAVMSFLPFEPNVFAANDGPPCHFVGHPIIERLERLGPLPDFKKKYRLKAQEVPLTVMPGSRVNEVNELVPVFGKVLRYLDSRIDNLRPIIPLVPHMADQVRETTAHWPGKPIYIENEVDKFAAFAASRAALASSGTATMELALAGLPTVVAYNMGLMGDLLVRLMPVPSVVLVNLILDAPAMPEFLQDRCDAAEIAPVLLRMLEDDSVNGHYRDMLGGFRAAVCQAGEKPADRAAAITLSVI